MAGFSGFSEEEIRRFKLQSEVDYHGEYESKDAVKKASLNKSGKRSKPREKVRTKQSVTKNNVATVKNEVSTSPTKKSNEQAEKLVENKNTEDEKMIKEPRKIEVIMEPEKIKEIELSNIEKMQQKQKEMEKINKKKEKMLQCALKERYKKTQKETETLKMVQKELSYLDHLLHADVEILRDKIDDAAREYDYAKKRYDRAEDEFINAKVNLHEKTETKDELMEHLCTIIQENEQRKAKKLAELMSKLEIGDQDLKEPLSEDEDLAVEKNNNSKTTTNDNKTTSHEPPQEEEKSTLKKEESLSEKPCIQEKSSTAIENTPPTKEKTVIVSEDRNHSGVKSEENKKEIEDCSNDKDSTIVSEPINR